MAHDDSTLLCVYWIKKADGGSSSNIDPVWIFARSFYMQSRINKTLKLTERVELWGQKTFPGICENLWMLSTPQWFILLQQPSNWGFFFFSCMTLSHLNGSSLELQPLLSMCWARFKKKVLKKNAASHVLFFFLSVTFKDSLHPAATSRLPSNLQPLQFKDYFGCQVSVHPFTRSSLFN